MKHDRAIRVARSRLKKRLLAARAKLEVTPRFTIDFETACDVDVTDVGAFAYSRHPSCRILMMSYCMTGNPDDTKLWDSATGEPPPQEVFDAIQKGHFINAHNSFFEYCIWNNVGVPKLDWPKIPSVRRMLDTADKCKHMAIASSLNMATQVMKIKHTKDPKGKALILLFSMPIKKGKRKGEYNDHLSHPAEWRDFCYYCIQDTAATVDLDNTLPDLPVFEQLTAWMTDEINWRGIHIDRTAVRAMKELSDKVKEKYNAEASILSGGLFQKCTQRAKVKEWLEDQGYFLPNMQGSTIKLWMRKKELPDSVKRMLVLYKIAGSTATSKYKTMLTMIDPVTHRIHELLNYHKARTGRYGGRGIQIQNLPRPVLPKGVDFDELIAMVKRRDFDELEATARKLSTPDKLITAMDILSSLIRTVITPIFGDHFKSADYAAIEARFLLWIAGDDRALDIFRRGEDIYLDMASDIYGIPYKELNKDSKERPLGKETILGAGYGMWAVKFRKRVDEQAGIKISSKEAERVIKRYRKRFPLVPEFWKVTEQAAIRAVKQDIPVEVVTKFTKILFYTEMIGKVKFLICRLPSGHKLYYPHVKVAVSTRYEKDELKIVYEGFDSYTHKWGELDTYGGKWAENITQAGTRDLMILGMLLLDIMRYILIMSVHDEVVTEDEDGFGSLEELEALLCYLPPWAYGLPVESEGWIGQCYRK
jgi:DNA polymerase